VLEILIGLFNDSKERIRQLAMEAVASFASIGNKFSVKEVAY
jgi:hypothetical protein